MIKSHLVYFCLCSQKIVFEICKLGLCSQVLFFSLTLCGVVLPTVHANIFSCYSGKKNNCMLRIKKEIFKETNMLFVSHMPFYCSLQNIKIALLSKGSSVPQWNCNNVFPKIMVSIFTDLSVIPPFSMHVRTWLHLNLH